MGRKVGKYEIGRKTVTKPANWSHFTLALAAISMCAHKFSKIPKILQLPFPFHGTLRIPVFTTEQVPSCFLFVPGPTKPSVVGPVLPADVHLQGAVLLEL